MKDTVLALKECIGWLQIPTGESYLTANFLHSEEMCSPSWAVVDVAHLGNTNF